MTSSPAVIVVAMTADELRALVREAVRDELAARGPAPSAPDGCLLTKSQLAGHLCVSPATLDRYVRAGTIPYTTLGPDGPRRFDLAAVREALAATEVAATPPKRSTDAIPLRGVRRLGRRTG
jgi:hypothetical protein